MKFTEKEKKFDDKKNKKIKKVEKPKNVPVYNNQSTISKRK